MREKVHTQVISIRRQREPVKAIFALIDDNIAMAEHGTPRFEIIKMEDLVVSQTAQNTFKPVKEDRKVLRLGSGGFIPPRGLQFPRFHIQNEQIPPSEMTDPSANQQLFRAVWHPMELDAAPAAQVIDLEEPVGHLIVQILAIDLLVEDEDVGLYGG